MAHTPGPWQRDLYGNRILRSQVLTTDGLLIASLGDTDLPEDHCDNASLIAAAPELLEACRDIYSKLCSRPDDCHVFDRNRAQLRDAIAKATGKAVQG